MRTFIQAPAKEPWNQEDTEGDVPVRKEWLERLEGSNTEGRLDAIKKGRSASTGMSSQKKTKWRYSFRLCGMNSLMEGAM
jgi:hypothetical protein